MEWLLNAHKSSSTDYVAPSSWISFRICPGGENCSCRNCDGHKRPNPSTFRIFLLLWRENVCQACILIRTCCLLPVSDDLVVYHWAERSETQKTAGSDQARAHPSLWNSSVLLWRMRQFAQAGTQTRKWLALWLFPGCSDMGSHTVPLP